VRTRLFLWIELLPGLPSPPLCLDLGSRFVLGDFDTVVVASFAAALRVSHLWLFLKLFYV
jgi:hypothetical protein